MTRLIAFIGSHCAGKTTMVNTFAAVLKAAGYSVTVIPELVRKCPYKINEESSIHAQRWIFLTFAEAETKAWEEDKDFIISDRCLLDHIPYTLWLMAQHKIEVVDGVKLVDSTTWLWEKFHVYGLCETTLIYCPVLPLRGDGVRSVDVEFQKSIDLLYRDYLNKRGVPYTELKR